MLRDKTDKTEGTVRKRFIVGVIWNLISALASRGFPMIAAILTARLLGKVGYGEFGIINSTVGMFSTFAGLGLGVTCTKYVAELRSKEPDRAGRIIGLTFIIGIVSGSILAIVLFFAAPWLASATLKAPHLEPELRITSLLLIFGTLTGVQNGALVGLEAFKKIAGIGLIQGISSFPITIGGVYFWGLRGAVVALVLTNVIGFVLNRITLNKTRKQFGIETQYKGMWKEADIIWNLSIPSMLSNVMVGPVVWIANTIIVNTPNGYAQLGLFNAANQWRYVLQFLPTVIGGVLLPMLAAESSNKNSRLETINVLLSWFIVTAIALPFIAIPELISILYGEEYASFSFIQTIALIMFICSVLAYKEGIARKLIVGNLMWWGVLSNLLWAILFIGFVLLLNKMGSLGLALSYAFAYVLNTLIFVPFYLWKKVVPRQLLLSKEVIIIWSIILIQLLATLFKLSYWIRIILLLILIAIMICEFLAIWKKAKQANYPELI
jgi:O-antigen/teichoic acid export membrane protein